jgi:hypothetical protein
LESDTNGIPENWVVPRFDVIRESNIIAWVSEIDCVGKAQSNSANGWINVKESEANCAG